MEWNNSYTLSSMQQQQQYQPNIPMIHPMMPQPNIPEPTKLQSFAYISDQLHQPEPNLVTLNRVTPENQAINNIGKFI
jgi:hypothetical protein